MLPAGGGEVPSRRGPGAGDGAELASACHKWPQATSVPAPAHTSSAPLGVSEVQIRHGSSSAWLPLIELGSFLSYIYCRKCQAFTDREQRNEHHSITRLQQLATFCQSAADFFFFLMVVKKKNNMQCKSYRLVNLKLHVHPTVLFPLAQAQETLSLLSVSMNLATPGAAEKWTHTVFAVLRLAYFTQQDVHKVEPRPSRFPPL